MRPAALEHWKAEQARVWGSGSWQNVAETMLFRVHDELVSRLRPQPGERWLDLATGTGAVALRLAGEQGLSVHVSDLLGGDFELTFAEAICPWTAESGEATWRLFVGSDGPAKTGVAALPPGERDALHHDWVDYFERHRKNGGVSVPRPYLLIMGRRRAAHVGARP